jgi:Zn-dependent peptidase ImmA (M78 family)
MDFGTERVDSRSILIEDKFPVIFYNKKLLGDRLRFTLAYELGHIVMHTRTTLNTFTDLSKEANSFAAELLMPRNEIIKDLGEKVDLELLAKLKGKWKASMHAILYRAMDLQVITENQKRYLINEFNALKIRRREPKELDLAIERGRLLRDLITTYRTKQKMNMTQIAEFFYLFEDEFLERYS